MEFISFPTIQAVDPKINDEKTIVGCHRVIAVLNIMKILVHHIMSITAVAVHERHDTVIWLQSNYTTLMVFPIEISHNLQIVIKFSEIFVSDTKKYRHWNGGPPRYQNPPIAPPASEYERPPPYYYPGAPSED